MGHPPYFSKEEAVFTQGSGRCRNPVNTASSCFPLPERFSVFLFLKVFRRVILLDGRFIDLIP